MWYEIKTNRQPREVAKALVLLGHRVVCFGWHTEAVNIDVYVTGAYLLIDGELPPSVVEEFGLEAQPWFRPEYCSVPGWEEYFEGKNVFPYWVLAYSGQYRWTPDGEEYTYWADRPRE